MKSNWWKKERLNFWNTFAKKALKNQISILPWHIISLHWILFPFESIKNKLYVEYYNCSFSVGIYNICGIKYSEVLFKKLVNGEFDFNIIKTKSGTVVVEEINVVRALEKMNKSLDDFAKAISESVPTVKQLSDRILSLGNRE